MEQPAIADSRSVEKMSSADAMLRQRLLSLIEVVPGPIAGSPCWLFVGARNNCDYGYLQYRGWPEGTHRLSWIIHRGPIPDGMWVLHRCDRPACCNAEHLFLG